MDAPKITPEEARRLRARLPGGDKPMDWRHGRETTERDVYMQLKEKARQGGTVKYGRYHSRDVPLSSLSDSAHRGIAREMVRVCLNEATKRHDEDAPERHRRRSEAI